MVNYIFLKSKNLFLEEFIILVFGTKPSAYAKYRFGTRNLDHSSHLNNLKILSNVLRLSSGRPSHHEGFFQDTHRIRKSPPSTKQVRS